MELLYLDDAYLKSAEAEVEAVDAARGLARFSRSVVYPGGGGQPRDEGRFSADGASYAIAGAVKEGDEVWYSFEGPLPREGARGLLEIDWDRRYALMRTHSLMHVLCGLVWNEYGKAVTGGNMEPLRARMDFDFPELDLAVLARLEELARAEIAAARPIRVSWLGRDADLSGLIRTKTNLVPEGLGRIRLVEIEGLDRQADGGTHVARTDEIGAARLVGLENKGKGNKRIRVELA